MNSRLDSLQAIILNHKLRQLSKLNSKRRKIASQYDVKITNKKIEKLKYSKFSIYHQYVLIVKNRNSFIKYLKKAKIQYGFHYPYAVHQLHALKKLFKREKFPNSEMLAKYGISIPIDPNLSKKDVNYIISQLNQF